MENKTIGIILAVMVSVLLVGGLLVPIVNDATSDTDTFTNKGIFYVTDVPDGTSIHYVWDGESLTINGEEVPIENIYSDYEGGASIIFTENTFIRYTAGSTAMAIRGEKIASLVAYDLTVSDGHITGTTSTASATTDVDITYTEFTGIVTDSSFIMANAPVYMNPDTGFNVTGFVSALADYYVVNVKGSIEDGATVSVYDQYTGDVEPDITVSDIVIDYSAVNGYTNLYELNKITFVISNGTASDNVTFTLMVVPEKVTADRSDPMDSAAAGVLSTAPILIIVALLAMVAAVLIRTRY